MCMCDIIAVSNRALADDFFNQLKKISNVGIPIILREKDLSESEYEALARRVTEDCGNVILHTFIDAAKKLNHKKIHLPMHILRTAELTGFDIVGASVHSAAEAVEAQKLGASYVTAGHIFKTDCKKGVSPRGLDFLKSACEAVNIPVYAIGGITPENAYLAADAGASGVCIMSGLMKCNDINYYINKIRRKND